MGKKEKKAKKNFNKKEIYQALFDIFDLNPGMVFTYKQLAQRLNIKGGDQQLLVAVLREMKSKQLLTEIESGKFQYKENKTYVTGIIDLTEETIRYCSAGHPPALLISPGADEISTLDVQSGVVGAFHDISYVDGVARLERGDVLLLYTDGTTEARDASGAFFGDEGLRDMVMRESAGEKPFDGFVERLLGALDAFTGHNLEDDVAMVAVRFDGLS